MKKASIIRLLMTALAMVTLVTSEANAQGRSLIGINGVLARPVGEFQDFVDWGGGINLYGVINPLRRSPVGIRIDGSVLWYGHETFRKPLSKTIQRVMVDVNTDNIIGSLGMGPQLTLGQGELRTYVYGTVGFSYFATVSSSGDARSTHFDEVTPALTAGGGLLLRLSRGKHPVSLNFSAQTIYHGETTYLRQGSILESPNGSISFVPIKSGANLVTFRFGIAIGV